MSKKLVFGWLGGWLLMLLPLPGAGVVLPFTGSYAENFDSLPAAGIHGLAGTGARGEQATVPGVSGWLVARAGGTGTGEISLATTPSTTGRFYSFGDEGSTDRALGSLASGSTVGAFGVALRHTGDRTWRRVTLRFRRETWLAQGTSTANAFADRLSFAWGIDPAGATPSNFLTYPTLTPQPSLDAVSPAADTVTGVAGGSSPDRRRSGNTASWSREVVATLDGLRWAPGQTLYLRWTDADDVGFDAGLAVDDLRVEASDTPADIAATLLLPPETPGHARLRWPTLPGAAYHVRESETLRSWTDVAGASWRADDFSLDFEAPLQPGARFFRVQEDDSLPPGQEVFFSAPGPGGEEADLTLEDRLLGLLEQAEAGSTVRAAVYTWTRTRMAEAFIAAFQRGVDVRLVVGSDYPAVELLLAALPGRVVICRDAAGGPCGCHGGSGRINHNKFFLFSALADGSTDVVVQSSANLTALQTTMGNNFVIVRDNAALHAAYLRYWNDLASRQPNANYYRTVAGGAGTRVWFFPHAAANGSTGAGDPVVEQLDAITPAGGGSLHVAMAFWTGPRRAIAQRLAALHRGGCVVSVVVHPQETSAEIISILRAAGVPVTLMPVVHSKYLLIDAVHEGERKQIVLTGSHNYTGPALTGNDETLLRLTHPRVYRDFLADWRRLAAHPLATKP